MREKKRKEDVASKESVHPKDLLSVQRTLSVRRKNDKKESEKGKERVVRKVLLAQKEPLYLLLSMCFHLSTHFPNLLIGFKQMLESIQDIFPKEISRGLSSITGIEHQRDFTMRATLPNQAAYRANLEESKKI
ncbi:hypothetical protein CR513_31498, partial [Mucuna pruriens]